MTNSFRTIAFAALAFSGTYAIAQNGVMSPFSRYGFGVMSDRSMGFNKGMGGIAQGYRDGQYINTANPAAYSACDSLTALFDFGMSLQNGNYKMGGIQQNSKNSSFDYAAFHFRATRGVGVAVALLPMTNIGYNISSQNEKVAGTEDVTSTYSFNGTGGLHQVMLGAGWNIIKPLSIGANVSYIYGDYGHSMTMAFNETTINSIIKSYNADISTYSVDFGAQYTHRLNRKDRITLGVTYTLGHDVNNTALRTTTSYDKTKGTNLSTTDTLCNAFQLPHSFAAGLTFYHKNSFLAGADFELQKWSNVKFPNQVAGTGSGPDTYVSTRGQFNDRMKISAGLAWTPNLYSGSFFRRMTYKVGGHYAKSYVNADASNTLTDKPYEFGATAGVTIPVMNRNLRWSTPNLHVSFQWLHTNVPYLSAATMKQSTLTENYLKLCVGLTFSERWFYQWKVK